MGEAVEHGADEPDPQEAAEAAAREGVRDVLDVLGQREAEAHDAAVDGAVERTVELLHAEPADDRDHADAEALEELLEDGRGERRHDGLDVLAVRRLPEGQRREGLREAVHGASARGGDERAEEERAEEQPPRLGLEPVAPADEEHVERDEGRDEEDPEEDAGEHRGDRL